MTTLTVSFTLNGKPVSLGVDPAARLLDTLRYQLALTGTKEGCGQGECGACTVYLDGLPVNSCLIPTYQVRGHRARGTGLAGERRGGRSHRRRDGPAGALARPRGGARAQLRGPVPARLAQTVAVDRG